MNGFWAHTNTSGNTTLSDGDPAVIMVAGLHFSLIGISTQFHEDSSPEDRFLASLWLLSDDLIETYHPRRGLPMAKRRKSELCKARVTKPTFQIFPGAQKRWSADGETGKQSAWFEILADLTDPTEAVLRFSNGATGKPEAHWQDEAGSEITSVVALDFIVEVQNPDEQSYELEFTPERVVAQALGFSEYGVTINLMGASGCRGKYPVEYSLGSYSDRADQHMDESGAPMRLRIEGDKHLQISMRFTGIANAGGGLMEPPFDGNSEIDVVLRFKITPVPDN